LGSKNWQKEGEKEGNVSDPSVIHAVTMRRQNRTEKRGRKGEEKCRVKKKGEKGREKNRAPKSHILVQGINVFLWGEEEEKT